MILNLSSGPIEVLEVNGTYYPTRILSEAELAEVRAAIAAQQSYSSNDGSQESSQSQADPAR